MRGLNALVCALANAAVSKLRLDARQRGTEVFWRQVDPAGKHWATDEVRAPVADAVAAVHDGDPVFALFAGADEHAPQRCFVATAHLDGEESIALEAAPGARLDLDAMDRIGD